MSTSKNSHESFGLASKTHIKILDLPTKFNYLFGFASLNQNPESATGFSHREFLRSQEALLIQFCHWKLGNFRSLYKTWFLPQSCYDELPLYGEKEENEEKCHTVQISPPWSHPLSPHPNNYCRSCSSDRPWRDILFHCQPQTVSSIRWMVWITGRWDTFV